MISTPHGVTFHALGVSSWAFDFELNFDLAHCDLTLKKSFQDVIPDIFDGNFQNFFWNEVTGIGVRCVCNKIIAPLS